MTAMATTVPILVTRKSLSAAVKVPKQLPLLPRAKRRRHVCFRWHDPDSTGAVNESQTGGSDLPTEEPIPGIDPITGLLPEKCDAVADNDSGVVTSLEEISVGSGVASVSADTGPLFSGSRGGGFCDRQ